MFDVMIVQRSRYGHVPIGTLRLLELFKIEAQK